MPLSEFPIPSKLAEIDFRVVGIESLSLILDVTQPLLPSLPKVIHKDAVMFFSIFWLRYKMTPIFGRKLLRR